MASNKQEKQSKGAEHMSKVAHQGGGTAGTAQGMKQVKSSVEVHTKSKSCWQSNLNAYQEKSAVRFSSQEDMNAFIDLIWGDKDLRGMPHVPAGDNTIIVPSTAEKLIAGKLFGKYCISSVLDPTTLSDGELAKLRKERDTV